APDQQARARNDFDLRRLRLSAEKRPSPPERRARELVSQKFGVEELIQDGGKRLDAARLNRHVGVEQLRSDDSDFRLCFHAIDKRLERVADDFRIGIQQQNELALRMAEAEIVRLGESQVVVALDVLNQRILATNFIRTVERCVIDDKRLKRKVL